MDNVQCIMDNVQCIMDNVQWLIMLGCINFSSACF